MNSKNKKRPDWVQKMYEGQVYFDKEIYPKMSYSEKVDFWTTTIHQHFRWQGESGYDQYSMFTPEWYAEMIAETPDFDKIMEEVIDNRVGGVVNKEEYLNRIGKK